MIRFSIYTVVLVLAMTSCSVFKYPEVRSYEGIKLLKMDGRNLMFEAKVAATNPNGFSLKVKPSTVFVSVENQEMGSVHLSHKLKLKRKSLDTLAIPFTVELAEGAMLNMLRFVGRDSVEIHLTGNIKGGIGIITKKQKIDLIRRIPGKMLRFKQ